MNMRKNLCKAVLGCIFSLAGVLLLSACGSSGASDLHEAEGYYFDTDVELKINDKNGEALLKKCFSLCEELENTFSPSSSSSELYKINRRTSDTVTVSDDMADCLEEALTWCSRTDGAFDITIYPVSSLWDFRSGKTEIPDEAAIDSALAKVDYTKVHLDGNELTFDSPDTMLDLGGIAKGYASAKIKKMLKEEGVSSALINLGGNVSTLGLKSSGTKWTVGIQKPFADRGETLTTVKSSDSCVISAGIYERYFEKDGKLYHHILDPKTGYPKETDLNQATVISTDDAMSDALSTICILYGQEKAEEFIKSQGLDVTVLFTDKNNNITWFPEESSDLSAS